MSVLTTNTRTHVLVGFANPFLICDKKNCGIKVIYWHDPDRCGNECDLNAYNHPCTHELGTISLCSTWTPATGCTCTNKETHDKE